MKKSTSFVLYSIIWRLDEEPEPKPPLHPSCRCVIKNMESVKAGTATINGTDGADWALKQERDLPDYYVTAGEAAKQGWEPGK